MAWFFLFAGAMLIISSWKGNQSDLFSLLKDDFTGQGNFIVWVTAVVFLVVLGNIKSIKPVSDAFLFLVILVIIIAPYTKGRDIIREFTDQIKQGTN